MEEYPTVIVYMRTDDAVTPCDTLGPPKGDTLPSAGDTLESEDSHVVPGLVTP